MSVRLRRALFALFALGTVSGWAVAIVLGGMLLPAATTPDPAIAEQARSFTARYLAAAADGDGDALARLAALTTSPLTSALVAEAEEIRGSAGIPGFVLCDEETTVLHRSAGRALVESILRIGDAGTCTDPASIGVAGEHLLLRLVDGAWLVEARYRLALIDPDADLVAPVVAATPPPIGLPDAPPSPTPAPTSVPAADTATPTAAAADPTIAPPATPPDEALD